tara:strand:+ start:392 stop:661 length:270 start_codon:yes stop_codon:yes gene_type:complete
MNTKTQRVRCSDEQFLEAVFSSRTYAEIAEKTGQKITTTMARYSRVKATLSPRGIELPKMERKKPEHTVDREQEMVDIVKRLKAHHANS